MPRSRSSGGGGFRSTGARAPLRNPPKPVSPSQPPAPRQDVNMPVMGGFGAAVADGMAFGAGSAVAHRAADAILGPRVFHHETVTSASAAIPDSNSGSYGDTCGGQAKAFQDCVMKSGSDISKCQFYIDMLRECQGLKEPRGAIQSSI